MAIRPDLSSRTLTFLFTDLESSTRLWEQFPEAMQPALGRHDALLRSAVETCQGQVVKTTGDGLMAVFLSAVDGVNACLQAQLSLRQEPWGVTEPLRVRMGLHVGEAQPRAGDYYGPAVNRAARLMSAAHGGQVLLSATAAALVADLLPEGMALRDLGEHRLKDLTRPEHIFQLLHPDLTSDFPAIASLDSRPNNLPAQPTPLIGREAELAEITKRLDSPSMRLLTLTGPGGIGKTRLALQAAADRIDRFEDGVHFIDLAPARDPESALSAIAQTLGIRETSEGPLLNQLIEQLRAMKMLLVLDNFEQVTVAAPHIVELLRDCPGLKLLVTSREALHLRAEVIFPVPPLALPGFGIKTPSIELLTQYEAVRLFIERAQAVKPDFMITNETAPAVAEICWRLDGLPLAIELAAARIRLFAPQALLERLGDRQGSRMNLLRGGSRDLPVRQQTLRDAIGWSYELLEPGEQRLFELLSVFSGGCSYEAVETVAGDVHDLASNRIDILDGLASLVEKSLVRQEELETGASRFFMLETIRDYAAERLADDPEFHAAARRSHASFFADLTQRQWARMAGHDREAALSEVASEIENVRTAWGYWVGERDLEQLSQLTDSLWLLYDLRGWYHQAVNLTNDLLEVLSSTPSTPQLAQEQILLQTSLARALLAIKGYTPEVEQAYTRALQLSQAVGEIPQLLPVLRGLSSLYLYLGEYEKGIQIGERILALAESREDANLLVEGHLVLGANISFYTSLTSGLEHLEAAIRYFDPEHHPAVRFRLGNNPGVASMTVSAMILYMLGYPDRALQRASDAVDLAQRLNHPFSMAYALFHAGFLHLWRREPELILVPAQAVLDIAKEYGFQVWGAVAACLQGAGLAGTGHTAHGLAQINQAMDLYRGLKTPPIFYPLLLFVQAWVCGQAGQPQQGLILLDRARQIAGPYTQNALLPEFYRLTGDLLLALDPQNAAQAEALFRESLPIAQELGSNMLELRVGLSLARLLRAQGNAEEGRRLLRSAYDRLTEGFTIPDLVEARELLGS